MSYSQRKYDAISSWQVTVLISMNLVAAGWLTLSRYAVEAAGVAAPLAVFFNGLAALAFVYLTASLCRRFPRQTLDELSVELLGTVPGKLLTLLFAIYFLMLAGMESRFFAGAIKSFLLERTPLAVVMLVAGIAAVYVVQYGINVLARMCEIFFPLVFGAAFLLLLTALQNFRPDELYPTFALGIGPALKAIPEVVLSFLGFEILFFCTPFMEKPQEVVKYALIGMLFPFVLYVATVVLTIGNFVLLNTKWQVFPGVTLARSTEFPGAFLERFDILFIGVWILAAYSTIMVYYYMGTVALTRACGLRHYRVITFLLAPFVYLFATLPRSFMEAEEWLGKIADIGLILLLVGVPLLYLSAILRKKGGQGHAQQKTSRTG